jgi:hypothetical protein
MRRMAEILQLRGKPKGPVAIAVRLADEDIGHSSMITTRKREFKPGFDRGRSVLRTKFDAFRTAADVL